MLKLFLLTISISLVFCYPQQSSYKPLNNLQSWTDYHKESGRLDATLSKCYECIRDRNSNKNSLNGYDPNMNPAVNTFTDLGHTANNFIGGNLAHYLDGQIVHSGGQFAAGNKTKSYSYESSGSYGSNYYNKQSPYHQVRSSSSLSCIVGTFGFDAYLTACEYGNEYCQINVAWDIDADVIITKGSCEAVCIPYQKWEQKNSFEVVNYCSTGTASNKQSPVCLVGDMTPASPGAKPTVCPLYTVCQLTIIAGSQEGSCVQDCEQDFTSGILCGAGDFGFSQWRGPLCYVGEFGGTASLKSCGIGGICKTVVSGRSVGSCVEASTCSNTTTISCTTEDYANKRGPICYVGPFNEDATPVACEVGQHCQRKTTISHLGTSRTVGTCSTTCTSSEDTYCCDTDLCNTYESTLKNKKCDTPSQYTSQTYGQAYGQNSKNYYL